MRRKYLISLGGLLGFTILILIFTYSRSSWVAFAFSMIVFLLLYFWRGLITPKFMKRVLPFALATTAFIVYYSGPIIERWEYRGRNNAGIEHRYKTADIAIDLISDNPILGVGLRNFSLNANNSIVHNSYLRLGAETGIPGLVLYFLLLAMIFKEGLKVVKSKDLLLSRIAIAILCGYLSFFIVNLTGPELRWFPILAQVWLFAGLLSAMKRIDMKIRYQERLNKKNKISEVTKTQNKDLKLQIENNNFIPPSKPH
ncbi:MAG: O-antigen ligase family protein [Bacteroidetes bacterium]|nr:O-antigen ligase family protein [Bacteroidota bacterium]